MTTYYVGPGGSDSNNGQSWANRKLTLNGAEDIPVDAGDVVYVGPGVFRETLTCDVSGSSGNPITYIGDVTGQNTDGIGGVVRITGSDDDLTENRNNAINLNGISWRTFRGFRLDSFSSNTISVAGTSTNLIFEDLAILCGGGNGIIISGASSINHIVRRCWFLGTGTGGGSSAHGIQVTHSATVNDVGHLIENCFFHLGSGRCVDILRVGGGTVRNCTMMSGSRGVSVAAALAAGQTWIVNNCIIVGMTNGFQATAVGEITEDYNLVYRNSTDRSNTATGANSVSYVPQFAAPLLFDDFRFPWVHGHLSHWSGVRGLAGSSPASDDLYGVSRPATASKVSWGAVQFADAVRDATTKRTGTASMHLPDARRVQLFVPVGNVSTTFSIYCYRQSDYAGTLPQMIIRQPGQSPVTVTDTGSASAWNELSTILTPAATPGYVVLELVSNNTATSGSYGVFFDDLVVSNG